ncbi:Mitotic spindle checkpoint protein Bub1/Mad [Quillaja saponaria]|uniref:Mitotic spindle checkpoint protein Bub1/Mad n=1 Tax=Quillaja saponaria TaxID=32244 RepID=A0AAD7LK33_QUISA|nr:Mitotic spindle checkpoint protein Bub1/Mad [Quillaja saponaria]
MATDNFFTSLISDSKTYTGRDPLLPWLRGIRKMKDSLPPTTVTEKLPRFLQKCAQTFESDRRYKNDLRYLRVWLQLMDFVDDPRIVLGRMEVNSIGTKCCLFYQAYALYYEKNKKFEDAEKMYHLGVKNLAEPVDDLQKSFEQFLHRMAKYKNKRIQRNLSERQELRTSRKPLSSKIVPPSGSKTEENNENICRIDRMDRGSSNVSTVTKSLRGDKTVKTMNIGEQSGNEDCLEKDGQVSIPKQVISIRESDEPQMFCGDDTVVVKFVDTAIVGKSEVEDACHHGLLDPTINMKEAMNDINGMFREPLETVPARRKSHRNQLKENHCMNNGFEVFIDESLDNGTKSSNEKNENNSLCLRRNRTETCQAHQEPLGIYIDDEESGENGNTSDGKDNLKQNGVREFAENFNSSASHASAFVFPFPNDLPSEISDDLDVENAPRRKVIEDTIVCKFVGSTISDEPEVENVCHHGLVDPTINMKEAMDDINNMFGKPIDFVRSKRSRKQGKVPQSKSKADFGGFSILADDDQTHQRAQPPPKLPGKSRESDLFEPTLFTKEALDDINKMFNMPLDF